MPREDDGENKFSYCKLRMALPPRENLTRMHEWDEEQYQMILRAAINGMRKIKYKPDADVSPDWKPRTGPRLYPRPVKGVSGNTVYYVWRVGDYTPLLAFLYDTVDLKEETVDGNIGDLRIQCVFAENAALRPADFTYIHEPVAISRNILDWLLRRIDRLEKETGAEYKGEVRISDILNKENSKYNDGYWIEAYYSADGLLVP